MTTERSALEFDRALACPDDGRPLERLPEGLRCAACGRHYPAADGILSLLPTREGWSEAEATLVAREREQRDREARRYDRLLGLRLFSLFEIPSALRPLGLRPDDRVLEVGCGTGRITRCLLRSGGCVLALDHSRASLRRLRERVPPALRASLCLAQADATRLPVRSGWATCVVSCQMLEHLPTEGMRAAAVAEMARVLAPGGRLALSAYRHLPALGRLLPREGYHSGAIYYHRFDREELAGLLTRHFRVERLTGRLLYVLLAHARREG